MKIFITGATGALGQRVVKHLIEQKLSVVALSRSSKNSDVLKGWKVEVREANLFNLDEVKEAMKDCDAILHLASSIPKKERTSNKDWKQNDMIRIDGTRNLIEAALNNGIKIFIAQSVTALYGQQHGMPLSSETPIPEIQPHSLRSAVQMEEMTSHCLPEKYLIIRFGNFYSEDDFHTNNLIKNIRKRRIPMIGDGNFYLNYIHIDDAADAVIYSLKHFESLKGRTVNVTDYKPLLYADILKSLYQVTGKKKPFYLPMLFAKLLLGKNNFSFLTGSHRIKRDTFFEDWQPRQTDFITNMFQILRKKNFAASLNIK